MALELPQRFKPKATCSICKRVRRIIEVAGIKFRFCDTCDIGR